MKQAYLEVTFRHGRPGQKSYRSIRIEPGLIVDLGRGGKLVGIEITAPGQTSQAVLNGVLKRFGLPTVKASELAPLKAAQFGRRYS